MTPTLFDVIDEFGARRFFSWSYEKCAEFIRRHAPTGSNWQIVEAAFEF